MIANNEMQTGQTLDRARSLVEEGKVLHAVQVYSKMINAEPSGLLPYLELSSLYAELGQLHGAIKLLLRASVCLPGHDEITFKLGCYHLRAKELDTALHYFKKLVGKRMPHVHFNMGMIYFNKNNITQAEAQFRLTMKLDPTFPRINESLGELLITRQAYAEAISYLKRGVGADPYSAVNHYLLGFAYSRIDQWKKAHSEFVLAVDIDPAEPAHWQMCAESLIALRRFGESEPYLRKVLELNPTSVDALVCLSQVFQSKGESEQAMEYIEKALSYDPANARAREARWKIQHKAKRSTTTK